MPPRKGITEKFVPFRTKRTRQKQLATVISVKIATSTIEMAHQPIFMGDRCSGQTAYLRATAFFPLPALCFFLSPSSRSSTAATIRGNPTVASRKTSPNFPPSAGGTNLPHDTASLYGLPDNPPQYTGSGQIRNP